jgi:hypothetical protein
MNENEERERGLRGLHRRSLLLGGAGLGAGLITASPLMEFAEAKPGTRVRQQFRGVFDDPATPDWHYLPFRMPRHVRSLEVRYEFHPTDTGVGFSQNVVDIGIFDPSGHELGDAAGFRGWSGGARRRFRINRHWATPGYLAGPMTPGRWSIILGPFLIVPPGTPWRVTVVIEHGEPVKEPFRPHYAPTSVPGTGPGWYRGDLHTHSVYSDGHQTPRAMVEEAAANGLDFMGTSDHNTNAATRIFGKVAPDGFLVVSGEEVTTRNGHWLATGTVPGTWVDWRYRAADNQLGRFADLVRDRGGVAIAAHPMVIVPGTRWDFGTTYEHMDAVEVWNSSWTGFTAAFNQLAVSGWQTLLASGQFVPAVGNSDSHGPSGPIGLAQTVYRLPTLSSAAIVDAARNGRCWITESSQVDLTFTAVSTGAGAATGEIGDGVEVEDGAMLACHLSASGVPGTLAQLVGAAGTVLASAYAENDGTNVLDADVDPSERFARVEVRRVTGTVDPTAYQSKLQMVALTNPIFIV